MPAQQWTWQCERVIPSTPDSGSPLLREVLHQLETHNWPEHDVFGVHLAFEEALVNAIKHGNRFDPAKKVHVRCRMNFEVVQIEIADEGKGFDPNLVPDPTDPEHIEAPNGRGIMLMRSFMTKVEYNAAGNAVFMEKRLASPAGRCSESS